MQTGGALETILGPGEIVGGKYRVERLIAQGGMAAVWAGVNIRTGKRMALKVVLGSFAASGDALDLFRSEALAASRIDHPNVVSIFDVIDHAGMPCIVMEMLDGESLDRYLAKKGSLAAEEAIALLLPAMRGVAAANAQGVVHRDLKPGNIFLCIGPDGRIVTSKVLDFGISVVMEKAIDRKLGAADARGKAGMFGTPAYMSPEHAESLPTIDARADVYGFGVLLFEALTGRAPFLGAPSAELFMRIISEPAPKVSQFRPDVSAELVAIVDRALAKSPRDRFQSLDHLIGALEEQLAPTSSLARALTPFAGVSIQPPAAVEAGTQSPPAPQDSLVKSGQETQVLYGLAREPPAVTVTSRRSGGNHWPVTVLPPVLQAKLVSWYKACAEVYGSIGFLQHRAARVALLAFLAMAVTSSIVALAWGRHSSGQRLSSVDGQANRLHTPSVEPLSVQPTRAQEPNPLVREPGPTSGTPVAGSYLLGNPANLRKAEGADPRLSGPRAEVRRPAAQVKGHTPRAGRLSASDF
jgi:serine/threonine-protein kinase